MKKIILGAVFISLGFMANSQKVFQSKAGTIKFFSKTPAENIVAVNKQTDIKLATNGQIVFKTLIKGFVFENALMGEHFNENYMETKKFPKATFLGMIDNIATIDFNKNAVNKITVTGNLEIHGVTKKITVPATVEVKNGKLIVACKFKIAITDYGIKGEYIGDKIAKELEITVDGKLE
jgi:YceI-like domain